MKKTVLYMFIYFMICLLIPFVITVAMSGEPKKEGRKKDKEAVADVTTEVATIPAETAAGTTQTQIVSYLREEVIHILKRKYQDIYFEDGVGNAFQIVERDDSGEVIEIMVGNVIMSGNSFAELMKLTSANFSITIDGMDVIFTVKKTN